MDPIPKYLSAHRKGLLFLPVAVGLLFWAVAVAFADERRVSEALRQVSLESAAMPMMTYAGTYEKYGLAARSRVVSTPFFEPDAMKRIAIAKAYRSKPLVKHFAKLCPAMLDGRIALVRPTGDGKYRFVSLPRYAAERGPKALKRLLARKDGYLVTTADSLADRRPDFRLVSWNAELPLDRASDAAALDDSLCIP